MEIEKDMEEAVRGRKVKVVLCRQDALCCSMLAVSANQIATRFT